MWKGRSTVILWFFYILKFSLAKTLSWNKTRLL